MWERGSCFYLSNYKANGWLNYWSDRSRSDWSCCSFEQWTDGVHVSTLVEQSHFFFYQNIADLKSIIGNNILKNERVIVFICTSATKATLSELVYENGKGVQKTLKTTIIRILPIQLQRASLLFWTMYKPMLPPNDMQWLSDATEWDGYLYREQFHAAACRLVKSTGSMNMHWWHVFWRNTNEISNWYYYACRRYFERGPKDGIYTFRWLLYVYGRGCLWP